MLGAGRGIGLLWVAVALIASATSVLAVTEAPVSEAGKSARFIDLSPARQAAVLGAIVGNGCIVKTMLFKGLDASDTAVWQVDCVNGPNYSVEISTDDEDDIPLVTTCPND